MIVQFGRLIDQVVFCVFLQSFGLPLLGKVLVRSMYVVTAWFPNSLDG